jgi:hypothetical protein
MGFPVPFSFFIAAAFLLLTIAILLSGGVAAPGSGPGRIKTALVIALSLSYDPYPCQEAKISQTLSPVGGGAG